jgi:hypothetical protein
MALFKFFKLPQHKTFNYQPRYFDERKEAMEQRRAALQNNSDAERAPIMRGSIRSHYVNTTNRQRKNSRLRLVLILGVLALAVYLFTRDPETLMRIFKVFSK